LLSDPALTVFENADAYLTCNYDPRRALCNPDNVAGGTASAPSLDRCQATCPNIARTDDDIVRLRERLLQHEAALNDPLSPTPRRARDQAQAQRIRALIERHEHPAEAT